MLFPLFPTASAGGLETFSNSRDYFSRLLLKYLVSALVVLRKNSFYILNYETLRLSALDYPLVILRGSFRKR